MTEILQIQKHEKLKQLCMASKKTPTAFIPQGYYLLDNIYSNNNGFYSCIYHNQNEIIIVYRSSDDKNDWLDSNKSMFEGHMPSQAYNALQVYDKINKSFKDQNIKLTVVGYSLGGSLAQIVGALRGVEAITFNAYGTKNLLSPNLNYNTDKIINYCCVGDIITNINFKNHIGKCFTVKPKNVFKNPHYLENMSSLYERKISLNSDIKKENKDKKYENNIFMPSLYSDTKKSNCTGYYPVSSYTRANGTLVKGYIRNCYLHGD